MWLTEQVARVKAFERLRAAALKLSGDISGDSRKASLETRTVSM